MMMMMMILLLVCEIQLALCAKLRAGDELYLNIRSCERAS